MPDQVTIRADQITGLPELVRDAVRAALKTEGGVDLQDMEEVRRSPAGTLIRVEGKVDSLDIKVDALETKLNTKIDALDGKVDALRTNLNTKIDALDGKMDALETRLNTKIDALDGKVDAKFDALERRLTLIQWVVGAGVALWTAVAGKLFLGG